jgi:hypothetical protein
LIDSPQDACTASYIRRILDIADMISSGIIPQFPGKSI